MLKPTLTEAKRKKSRLEGLLRQEHDEKKNLLKQILVPWKKVVRRERKERIKTFKTKINHLKEKQKRPDNPYVDKDSKQTVAPIFLKEYGQLRIFSSSEKFPKKETPKGPFIGSKNIVLSDGERKVLSRDPKYSLRQKVNP